MIEKRKSRNHTQKVLSLYYRNGKASWTEIVEVLRRMKMVCMADKIEARYCRARKSGSSGYK